MLSQDLPPAGSGGMDPSLGYWSGVNTACTPDHSNKSNAPSEHVNDKCTDPGSFISIVKLSLLAL